MGVIIEKGGSDRAKDFNLDEVVRLKGHYFKVVLIDGFAGKLALKWISVDEARILGGPVTEIISGSSVQSATGTSPNPPKNASSGSPKK